MRPKRKPCAVQRRNHSRDRVTVFYGAQDPITLCGFHAQQTDRLFTLSKGAA